VAWAGVVPGGRVCGPTPTPPTPFGRSPHGLLGSKRSTGPICRLRRRLEAPQGGGRRGEFGAGVAAGEACQGRSRGAVALRATLDRLLQPQEWQGSRQAAECRCAAFPGRTALTRRCAPPSPARGRGEVVGQVAFHARRGCGATPTPPSPQGGGRRCGTLGALHRTDGSGGLALTGVWGTSPSPLWGGARGGGWLQPPRRSGAAVALASRSWRGRRGGGAGASSGRSEGARR
jgi:hypothetical protein